MNENEIIGSLVKEFSEIKVNHKGDDYVLTIPFTDFASDPIQVSLLIVGNELVIDDLGRTAGLMFGLGQHTEDTSAFHLVRNISETYNITMDFDEGVLRQTLTMPNDFPKLMEFLKVICTLQVAIPELKLRKPKIEKSKLTSRLSHDIKQLKLPLPIEKQTQAIGEKEIWPVNFKYEKQDINKTEILVVTADLATKDPRQRASTIIASAIDLMKLKNRALRVVYEVDGIGKLPEVQRAKNLIDQHQADLKYRAFNYAEKEQKETFLSLTREDAVPLM